jgi:hypothetical protein
MRKRTSDRTNTSAIWALALVLALCMQVVLVPASTSVHAGGAASLYLAPSTGDCAVGGITFDVQIRVDTGPDAINAIEAVLAFPPGLLEVTGEPSVAGSVLEFWMPETTFDNVLGIVHVTGGVPSGFDGGFMGDGLVVTVQFRTKSTTGTAVVSVDQAQSLVLRSSENTDVLASVVGGSYTLTGWASGDLLPTGGLRITGQVVEVEYELSYGGIRVDLSPAVVHSITVSYEGGTPSTVAPDATGNVWFDSLSLAGTYDYVIVTESSGAIGATYHASIEWAPGSAAFVETGAWQKVGGKMFIPFSCGLDLSTASSIAMFEPGPANPELVSVPAGADLLFSIARAYGQYTFVIMTGSTVTIASLIQGRTGDVNHDGVISIFDASVMMTLWGPCDPSLDADLNADGSINIYDASMEMTRWTPVP